MESNIPCILIFPKIIKKEGKSAVSERRITETRFLFIPGTRDRRDNRREEKNERTRRRREGVECEEGAVRITVNGAAEWRGRLAEEESCAHREGTENEWSVLSEDKVKTGRKKAKKEGERRLSGKEEEEEEKEEKVMAEEKEEEHTYTHSSSSGSPPAARGGWREATIPLREEEEVPSRWSTAGTW